MVCVYMRFSRMVNGMNIYLIPRRIMGGKNSKNKAVIVVIISVVANYCFIDITLNWLLFLRYISLHYY